MKCPLLSAGEYTRNVSAPTQSCDCLQKECAWWDEERYCCLFRTLSKKIIFIAEEVKLKDAS